MEELVDAVKDARSYNKTYCHEYVMNNFSSKQMAIKYVEKYEMVLNGSHLNYSNPILKEIQNVKFLPFTN